MSRIWMAWITCLALWLAPFGALAQDATAVADPSANDLHEFTRLLSDPRIQHWLATQADEAEVDDAATANISPREHLVIVLAETRERMADIAQARPAIPKTPSFFAAKWRDQLNPAQQVRGLTFVLIFLFVGAGLEWLYRQYTSAAKLRIELNPGETIRGRVTAAALRTLITSAGLAIFALGSIGMFAAFSWPPALETFVLNLLIVVFAVRAIHTLLILFLAPKVRELRLVPLNDDFARRLNPLLLCLSAVYILTATLANTFMAITGAGPDTPQAIAAVLLQAMVALTATYVAIFAGFRIARKHAGVAFGKAVKIWRIYLLVLATLAFAALILNRVPLMWLIVLIGLLPPALRLLRLWVDGAFDRAIVHTSAQPRQSTGIALPVDQTDKEDPDGAEPETGELLHPYESYRAVTQRALRLLTLFFVAATISLIWDFSIFERAASPTVAGRIFALLIDSAVALLIADLIWVWASSAIDRRLANYRPPEHGTAPGPEARIATLLPLLRVTLMITLLTMVAMSILTSLGVNVAPLLAGAGVVGVAIGFGAQSLVKDVVSGVFFLIDDAFRVGEYVEIDNLRGTVERISIRSLQIRHHRGAVHTLPFGELKHLTNHSRDWVIMKLEFRVPFDTDLKLVKKLIKTIGATLKENEEYGDSIIETLKSQGVRRMEEFNMVVGVKFMTRPGEQWLVRRDAYQMVRDAFEANGIRMAERNVKVEVAGADQMNDEERQAVAGAAQQAIEERAGPSAPVPDEP